MTDTIPDSIPQKQCTACKKTFPATTEYFHAQKSAKCGMRSCCKKCRSAIEQGRIAVSAENAANTRKECVKCHKEFPATDEFFQRNKRKRDGFHQQCKECKNTAGREHRLKPEVQEHTKHYTKEYQKRPEVKKRVRIYQQRPEQQERVRTYKSRPEVREHKQAWTREYTQRPDIHEKMQINRKEYTQRPEVRERHRINTHNRRARTRSVQGTHTSKQIAHQLKQQKYRCYYAACGFSKFQKIGGKYIYDIEHTFPLSRVVGTDIPANDISYLVLACPTCNTRKANKFPWEWPEGGRLF